MNKIITSKQLESVKKILVCQLRQIGDVLLATPSVELLHKRFPNAEIHFLTEQKCASLLENNPFITKVWTINKKELKSLIHELHYYIQIAKESFDLVVDFQQLPRCRWVVGFSRAPLRITHTPPWYNRLLYTHWLSPKPRYAAAFKAMILELLGIYWSGETPKIFLREEELEKARIFLQHDLSQNKIVSLDITHRHSTREWPLSYYTQLVDLLGDQRPNLRFLLSYGPGEREIVETLQKNCRHKDKLIIPPTMLSLRELAACMHFASLHIGNCSAPRHIAVASDLPSITFLGATSTDWTYPSSKHINLQAGLPCQPCNKNTCSIGIKCLYAIRPEFACEQVLQHMDAMEQEKKELSSPLSVFS